MSKGKRIAALYRSVYEGDDKGEAWHGPALKALLRDITAEQASRQPKAGTHSIAQLVLHLAYWEEIMLRRLNGETVEAPLNTPDDWPANRKFTDGEWKAALQRLEASHAAMQAAMEAIDELDENVYRKYDRYAVLHGMIHHCVYHTAQIALAKKEVV